MSIQMSTQTNLLCCLLSSLSTQILFLCTVEYILFSAAIRNTYIWRLSSLIALKAWNRPYTIFCLPIVSDLLIWNLIYFTADGHRATLVLTTTRGHTSNGLVNGQLPWNRRWFLILCCVDYWCGFAAYWWLLLFVSMRLIRVHIWTCCWAVIKTVLGWACDAFRVLMLIFEEVSV